MKYKFHWRDGKTDIGEGETPEAALTALGYGRGAVGALDYYEPVEPDTTPAMLQRENEILSTLNRIRIEISNALHGPSVADRLVRYRALWDDIRFDAEHSELYLLTSDARLNTQHPLSAADLLELLGNSMRADEVQWRPDRAEEVFGEASKDRNVLRVWWE